MKLIIFLLLAASSLFAQETYTVSGYVKDKASGEVLIGATVAIPEAKTGANSNVYGFYSITLPAGKYKLVTTYVGFKKYEKEIDLTSSVRLDIELKEDASLTQEVIVTATKEDANVESIEMSSIELSTQTIKKIPALLGEVDVIRSIQLLPGVSTVGEGATGFNVRGGGVDQNLVLLDEAPVFNQSHLFGFFSVFNPDAVKDVKLIKGGIPASYGGRLSSILDVRLKEGNNRKFDAQGGIGTIFSRFAVEGPIIKDKLSFIVAGRRSYVDVLAKPFLQEGLEDSQFYFYDLTAKANWKIDDNNTVFASGYLGRDVFGAGFTFDWGNQTGSLRWNHLFSDKLFSNLTYYYSNYDYAIGFGGDENDAFRLSSDIITQGLKYDFDYFMNSASKVKFGMKSTLYRFVPGQAFGASDGEQTDVSVEDRLAAQLAAFIDHEYDLSDDLSIRYGTRFSYFNNYGPYTVYTYEEDGPVGLSKDIESVRRVDNNETIEDYFNFEPRLSLKYTLNNTSSLKLGYNRMAQYIHLISNTAAATPVDLWQPSSNNVKPQLADQIALGYFRNFNNNEWETSVEVYYKDMQNLLGYVDGANITLNANLEADFIQGDGRAYGAEFYIKRTRGKLNGWLSYTLSRSERLIEGINNNEWYAARFDQTNKINLTAIYDLSDKWSFSSNFVYLTGTPATFPTDVVVIQGVEVAINGDNSRNQDRISDYHRIDLSATYRPFNEPNDWWKGEWVFSVYNLYNRRNAYSFFPETVEGAAAGQQNRQITRFSVIGSVVPSVTYNFNFDIDQVVNGEQE